MSASGDGCRSLVLKLLDQSRQDALQVGGGRDPQWLVGGLRQAASSGVRHLLSRGTRTAIASGGRQRSDPEYPETSRNDRSGHPDRSPSALGLSRFTTEKRASYDLRERSVNQGPSLFPSTWLRPCFRPPRFGGPHEP